MKMNKILVTGAGGMLGTDVVREFAGISQVTALDRHALDITDRHAVMTAVRETAPDVVINCAAFTKVDECEENPELAFRVNANGPENLSLACRETGALLVHFSTDYVFDGTGTRPYMEEDPVKPINVYGKSKLEGETRIASLLERFLIIRTAWLFGMAGPNFIRTMLALASNHTSLQVVDDQHGSPTWTRDLAAAVRYLAATEATGIVHCTSSGSCSWYDLCLFAFSCMGIHGIEVKPVGSDMFPRPARRPHYSVLDNSRFQEITGTSMPGWKQAVSGYCELLRGNEPDRVIK